MLDSGIRQKEVCELQKADIDKERMLMKVTGKGAKDRLVPLGYISSLFLDDYLSQCPYSNTAYVFVDRLGRPLSGNAVRVFVNRLQKNYLSIYLRISFVIILKQITAWITYVKTVIAVYMTLVF